MNFIWGSKIKICDCEVCTTNLTKPNNGKLQIWYGTGANGKTTILNEVVKKVQATGKTVQYLTPDQLADYRYDASFLDNNVGLYVITEITEQDDLDYVVRSFRDHGNKWVRHIVCTNVPTSYETPTQEVITCYQSILNAFEQVKFEHVFHQKD